MLFIGVLTAAAQSSINSPYTRYGLGDLIDPVSTNNAAMGGLAYGLRNSAHINVMNPASYTSVDSLSFMFDVGFSLNSSNYKENGIKANAKNSTFDYLTMQFRLHKRLGMVMGFIPYSNVGYNFENTYKIENSDNKYITNYFSGDGGMQQIFAGLGFKITNNLSIGANFGYLYGNIKYSTTGVPEGAAYTINYNRISIDSYKFDFGVQYTQPLNSKDELTIGLTYGMGHKLNSVEKVGTQLTNGEELNNLTEKAYYDAYSIPHTFGLGAVYSHDKKIKAGLDYTFQKWEGVNCNQEINDYSYNNRSKVAAGLEYLPNPLSRNYLGRISYRIGASFQNSYLKLPSGINGPKECSASFGFGFPLKLYQRNSVLSLTGQYTRVNPAVKDMLSENRFTIKIGLTFDERWFMKWRVN